MKKVVLFMLKVCTCIWFGSFLPLMLWAACSINLETMTRAGAVGLFILWGIVGIVLGVLMAKGDNK